MGTLGTGYALVRPELLALALTVAVVDCAAVSHFLAFFLGLGLLGFLANCSLSSLISAWLAKTIP